MSDSNLGRLRQQLGRSDEPLVDSLDGWMRSRALSGLSRPELVLGPYLDGLLELDYVNHPWAGVAVSMASLHLRPADGAAQQMIDAAEHVFRSRGDDFGQGVAIMHRGFIHLASGRIAEAVECWRRARDLLGERSVVNDQLLAHLAFEQYEQGRLAEASALAEEASALSAELGKRRNQGMALCFSAFFALHSGDFSAASRALTHAEDVLLEVPDREVRVALPLVFGATGVVHSLSGDVDEAERWYEKGVDLAREIRLPWYEAMVRAARAELTAQRDVQRAQADARWAFDTTVTLRDSWWRTWALRSLAVASGVAREYVSSDRLFRDLLEEKGLYLPERARTLLAYGEMLANREQWDAAELHLRDAASLCDNLGMLYWHVRALIALSEIPVLEQRELRDQAVALAMDHPAYTRLVVSDGLLQIKVLGDGGVYRHGNRIKFATRHAEQMIQILAISSRHILHKEEMASRLWPDAPLERRKRRLITARHHARQALGPEAWRLSVEGDLMCMNLDGVSADWPEAEDSARRVLKEGSRGEAERVLESLADPVLPNWAHEEWVHDEEIDRQGLVARLQYLVGNGDAE